MVLRVSEDDGKGILLGSSQLVSFRCQHTLMVPILFYFLLKKNSVILT